MRNAAIFLLVSAAYSLPAQRGNSKTHKSFPAPAATDPQHRVMVINDAEPSSGATVKTVGSVSASASGDMAAGVISEIRQRCPKTVTVTADRSTAEYILIAQARSSRLKTISGDVLYVSPAATFSEMAKDVCEYVSSH